MQATPKCCMSASTTLPVAVSDDPFSQMVVLDYYDGPSSGFLKCEVCGAEYHFFMLDWDDAHAIRIFALARVPEGSLQRLLQLFKANPDQRVWVPPALSRASEEKISDWYERGIQEIIDRAATSSLVIAWSNQEEKTLAMRGLDPAAASHLTPWFDSQPEPVMVDWFGYLVVARSLQPA